ncbi:hypothetical protein OG883_28750 [Streptomyces sp. NBC_01142]|nr:hypothetical protein [Streptomyces sp. NBC_01142]MCX4823793.1 hypothetical protein [Streptomyces sp. NBC_01142]
MGIDIPCRINNGDIDPLLETFAPKMTPEQITQFAEEAYRRA